MSSDDDLHAEFCRELGTLRLLAEPPSAALEQAVRQLREGADFGTVLAGLDVSLIEPLRSRAGLPPPVAVPGAPVRGTYICPVGACRRVEKRRPGQGPPECLIHEQRLNFIAE
jgi:hypothetical protein